MSKFEFRVTKIENTGKIWEHRVIIRADEKLNAFGKIREIFPEPEYQCEFLGAI